MSLYDEKDVVQFHVQKAEILSAASRVLGDHRDPGDETDAWLAKVIADRYANQPRDVTIDEYMQHLDQLFRSACESRRKLINGYGGNVRERA